MKTDEKQFADVNKEFAEVVSIEAEPSTKAQPKKQTPTQSIKKKKPIKKVKTKVTEIKKAKKKKSQLKKHLPSLEDGEGFDGRRPLVDPFVVGEEIILYVKYFNMVAGIMSLKTLPFKKVNGRKSYHFQLGFDTNSTFSFFYSAKNIANTFVDYEDLVPHTLTVRKNESKKVVDSRSYFNHKTLKAKEWEKKVEKGGKTKQKELEWDILEYSQNIISAFYYLRTFTYKVGKKIAFRVSDDGKNYVFKGEVVRKEKIKTPYGEVSTHVVKATFTMNNKFKPSGDNFFWVTDDQYRRIVRLESKVKIGTLVGKVKSIKMP